MSIRLSFVQHFGEEDATRIEEASIGHLEDPHKTDTWGSDPFRYHLMNAIGHECVGRFRQHHGIVATEQAMREWCKLHGDLLSHDGDQPDYIGLLAGAYYPWIDWSKTDVEPPEEWKDFEFHHVVWTSMTDEEKVAEMKRLSEDAMKLLKEIQERETE